MHTFGDYFTHCINLCRDFDILKKKEVEEKTFLDLKKCPQCEQGISEVKLPWRRSDGKYLVCLCVLARLPLPGNPGFRSAGPPGFSRQRAQDSIALSLTSCVQIKESRWEGRKSLFELREDYGTCHRKCTARHTVAKGVVPMQALHAHVALRCLGKQESAGITWSHD